MKYNSDVIMYLKGRKGKVICLNDSEREDEFESHKRELNTVFDSLFPDKSSFEL